MKKLSQKQEEFMTEVMAAGDSGLLSPHTSGRASVSRLAAWYRTAESLARRNLVTLKHNGSMTRAFFVGR